MHAIKHLNSYNFIILSIFLFVSHILLSQTQTANYTVTFQGTWSAVTHPSPYFPDSAHWSNLVGATHNSNVTFVVPGTLASTGIENVAETGINDVFNSEVQNAITAGNAYAYLEQVFDAFSPTSSASVNITADKDFPLLSLASMIAPSSDWMIQVNSLSLIDTNGNWKPSIDLDLFPYDAGTEEGDTYSFDNPDTIPQEPISSLQNVVPFSNEKVGTLAISLISLGIDEVEANSSIYITTNTSNKSIDIHNPTQENFQKIEIYNVLGNKVKSFIPQSGSVTHSFSIPGLKNSLYIIKLSSKKGIITKKVFL